MFKPISIAVIFLAVLLGSPIYMVFLKTYLGKAELAKQELLAQAEIARAHGVAESNQIIGQSLTGKENYLRYLWIQSLSQNDRKTLIYVPTEANIPILEAGRAAQP